MKGWRRVGKAGWLGARYAGLDWGREGGGGPKCGAAMARSRRRNFSSCCCCPSVPTGRSQEPELRDMFRCNTHAQFRLKSDGQSERRCFVGRLSVILNK